MALFGEEHNHFLDEIIMSRRTTRAFEEKEVEDNLIEAVIQAGMISPYASISAEDVSVFRHFYVIKKGSHLIKEINQCIKIQTYQDLMDFHDVRKKNTTVATYGDKLEKGMGVVANQGVPGLEDAPCLIVMAEWRGARMAEKQSLAHAMQNMWLKATALNLGFRLVSPLENLVDHEGFCRLFDLEPGQYGFHGCIVGYPKNEGGQSKRLNGKVHWMKDNI